MTSVLKRRGKFVHGDTQGRRPCEDEGKDWSDAAVSQKPRIHSSHQKLEETRTVHGPAHTLISDFEPPALREKKFLLF